MSRPIRFKGGVHPHYNKELTASMAIEAIPLPGRFVVPLSQNLGGPAKCLVEKGQTVLKGQPLGEPSGFVSTPVHAPTSGKVKKIDLFPHPLGREMEAVEIEPDGEDRWAEGCGPLRDIAAMDGAAIRKAVRDGGLVGMGGATFPTHVKLSPPAEKPIDTFILNGAECEPFLTSDHQLMLSQAEKIIEGGRLMGKVLGASKLFIGIEKNKPDAIERMRKAAEGNGFEVAALDVTYPQGAEKQLIYALTKRKVPTGGLPMDVGCVVHNVGTAAAAYDACAHGIPLIERVVTLTGRGIKEPKNLLLRVGTLLSDVIGYCGGLNNDTVKVIVGGPMMGVSQYSLDIPIIKGTSGIVFLTADEVTLFKSEPCIRCASCVKGCPMGLLPTVINAYSVHEMFDVAEEYNALDCIECGCCAFSCPSHIPLVQNIRRAKAEIQARRKKAG
jgi:electron transport complex protein RnfC